MTAGDRRYAAGESLGNGWHVGNVNGRGRPLNAGRPGENVHFGSAAAFRLWLASGRWA